MCGIFGLVARNARELRVEPVRKALRHRGPDGHGTFEGTGAGRSCVLVHTRLAIIDLTEGGKQPMATADGRYVIAFNGEIYNHAELRRLLEGRGHTFRSTSDTEVLLAAYVEWGPSAVERLRGMFAFGIWDAVLGRLFLARDRLGIKPLYYASVDGGIAFASEVRALLASGLVSKRLSASGVRSYLFWGSVVDPETIIDGVLSLPPASWLFFDGTETVTRTYWEPWQTPRKVTTFAAAVEIVRPALRAAAESHLVSDVPVGVFLSGGIDSSAITALMRQANRGPIHTFSVGLPDDAAMNESSHAATVARALGTDHHALELTGERARSEIELAIRALDQPSSDGVNTYFVAKVVREEGIKVVLSGLGGDEVFAGYPMFRSFGKLRAVTGLAPTPLRALIERLARASSLAKGREAKLATLLTAPRVTGATYALIRSLFTPSQVRALAATNGAIDAAPIDVPRALTELPRGAIDDVNLFAALELTNYLRNTLLRDTDTMSMASGLEVRVPYLDHELVETVMAIPGHLKLSPEINKPLLVAASPELPRSAVRRPKMGFQLPFDAWLRGSLKERVTEAFFSTHLAGELGLIPRELERLWTDFQARSSDVNAQRIWSIAALLLWCQENGLVY